MRYAMALEYDGSPFMGWQKHDTGDTIQAAVEKAVSFVADAPVEVVCSGRTDARVSARCQVVHFDSDAPRDARAWVLGTNTRLPDSIRALWLQPVSEDFHARYSARARRYRYSLLIRAVKPAIGRQFLSWSREDLDVTRMHDAAQKILGEQDFSAFRTVQCQAKHPNRNLHRLDVSREGDTIYFDVQANAFLHHMVRNLVGSLMLIGKGEQPVDWMKTLLDGKDRTVAGPTAPAEGLMFLGALYPPEWGLPDAVTLT
ncbi:MAG: tRNA pseudouridine(38-40) synthase TruA [Arenimonas sp.]|uniref:tRNA pseudouridine(38-40) synthase TruA n=1 Tax=Arenimonas sp. TaxID=1872635 RepID=UPI003C071814